MSATGRLTACGCCEGVERRTPQDLFNRPGLEALAYRVGTHGRFKTSMLAEISTRWRLRSLTTRQDDDFAIALMDAWAVVLDILSFYQERIANEGFLRTAVERRSLLELGRLIGYELAPGVAASTHLAFTLDDKEGSPAQIVIPRGTAAQSVPGQNELPQTFETSDDVVARPEWSRLRPRLTHPQTFHADTRVFYVEGTTTGLTQGDPLLLVADPAPDSTATDQQLVPLKVVRVETFSDIEAERAWTRITLDVDVSESGKVARFQLSEAAAEASFSYVPQVFTGSNVNGQLLDQAWSSGLLTAFTSAQGWSLLALGTFLFASRNSLPIVEASDGLYALRSRASVFGHNALHYATLPSEWKTAPYTNHWDDAATGVIPAINQDALGDDHSPAETVFLDREYPDVVEGSFVVISGGADTQVFKVSAVTTVSRADFGLSAKSTRLTLAPIGAAEPSDTAELGSFPFREASIATQSEQLTLIDLPIEDDVAGDVIELEQVDLLLEPGRTLVVEGERSDLEGVVHAEAVQIKDVQQIGYYTQLVLEESLRYAYKRTTTTIYANVAAATHGESRNEILGSGDASQAFRSFGLRHNPLTHVPAAVPSGAASTAQVRVDGVPWDESPDFYRLQGDQRSYVLRRDDDGTTHVQFGDGLRGARLPTGVENVAVHYRVGIGTDGHLDPGRISLLSSPPLGVREVTNPVAASGGEDPEQRDDARRNAPTTVKTLDRIVSLTDFEDFARTYGGIAKARADWVWDGARRVIFVTVAGVEGDEASDTLLDELRSAMDRHRAPFQPIQVGRHRPLFFQVQAALRIEAARLADDVLAKAEQTLRDAFSFEARGFAQGVHRSEVTALLQGVPGVIGVDLTALDLVPSEGAAAIRIDASLPERIAVVDEGPVLAGAQLLTVTPEPLGLEELP